MIRFCMSMTIPVKAKKKSNGKWFVDGPIGGELIEALELREEISKPSNASFYMATEASECLDRLENNMSDSTNVLLPIDSVSSGFRVPQPVSAGTLSFVTGYNVTEGEQDIEDTATVLTNADLLKPEVYCWSLFLVALFVAFMVLRIIMFRQLAKRYARMSPVLMIRRQVSRMFYYNSERFKWITLLYSLLCFIMVTLFLCLYKTSHIIIDKPFYPKSYQESLDHPSSLAFCYDQFSVVSTAFKNAPPDSIRGKLWAKLLASGRQDEFSGASIKAAPLSSIIQSATEGVVVNRNIIIVSPLVINLMRSGLCGLSLEGELWIIKSVVDPIEKEVIYGYAQSRDFHLPWFSFRINALYETGYLAHTYEKQIDQSKQAGNLVGTNNSHQWRQSVVCYDEDAFASGPVVKAISLPYFAPMIKSILIVWLLALILHFFQILHAEQ